MMMIIIITIIFSNFGAVFAEKLNWWMSVEMMVEVD